MLSEKQLEKVRCISSTVRLWLRRGDLMLPGIPWMHPRESQRCLCQLQWDCWKVPLEVQIPANWQRGQAQAPLFANIGGFCVCQADTLSLASMNCLFLGGWASELAAPGASISALGQVTSTFLKLPLNDFSQGLQRKDSGCSTTLDCMDKGNLSSQIQ